jgi:hypothetical protein
VAVGAKRSDSLNESGAHRAAGRNRAVETNGEGPRRGISDLPGHADGDLDMLSGLPGEVGRIAGFRGRLALPVSA